MKKTFVSIIFLLINTFAWAGPGHDHGESEPAAMGEASPRAAMQADLFEAVAILKGRTLEIFIDHAATNAPVQNARPALLVNGEQVPLELHAEGEFDAVVPESMIKQNLTLALQVQAGEQSEVLSGELTVIDQHIDYAEHQHGHLLKYLPISAVALLLFVFMVAFMKRRNTKGVK